MKSFPSRNEELTARRMLARPGDLSVALKEKRRADVAALVCYAREQESRHDLAMTDAALCKTPRQQITTGHILGGGALNLEKLRQLAARES